VIVPEMNPLRPQPVQTRVPTSAVATIWHGVDHAEDVAVQPDGVVWCGGEDGQVYRGALDGEPDVVATLPGQVLGVCADGAGGVYAAVMGPEAGIYGVSARGEVRLVSNGTADRPPQSPNYLVVLDSGVLLWTDSGEWGDDDGRIYAVEAGSTTVADTSCCRFPNGLAVSPDGRTLAVVESRLPGVSELSIAPDGSLADRRVLVELPGAVPDGLAYDERGRLLISCYAPDAILVLEDGEVDVLAHDPQRMFFSSPTNLTFVPGTRTLVVANLGDRFLSVLEHDAAGARA
jgi:gluconolactonase